MSEQHKSLTVYAATYTLLRKLGLTTDLETQDPLNSFS
jgi:hypothetical protein